MTDGIRLRRDRDEDEAGGVRREVPGLPAALEVVVGPDLHLLHLVRMQQVLDAAQVLRRRGASIGRRVVGAAPAREGRRTIDAPCAQLAKMTRSSVRATARNVTFPRGASAMGCGAHQAMARGASELPSTPLPELVNS